MSPIPGSCATCGAPLRGPYCHRCGERTLTAHDLSLRGSIGHALEAVTSFDSRAIRSLQLLLTRPGLLTRDYAAGRRQPYLAPLQLFLVVNLLFFIAASFLPVPVLDTPLQMHLNASPYAGFARDLLRDRFASDENLDYALFQARFNLAAEQYAKSLFIVLVPLFAAIITLLRMRRGEPAGQHVAFALHLLAYTLLLFIGLGILLGLAQRIATDLHEGDVELAATLVILLSVAGYLTAAFRRAYGSGTVAAVAQAAILAAVFIPSLALYRLILFLAVFHTI